jgi:hypothetical protein
MTLPVSRSISNEIAAIVTGLLMIDLIAGPIPGGYLNVGSTVSWAWWALSLRSSSSPSLGIQVPAASTELATCPPFWQVIGVIMPPRNWLHLIRNARHSKGLALS